MPPAKHSSKAKKKDGPNPNYKRHYRLGPVKQNNTSEEYPMRVSRFLALKGKATRREADELIALGKVLVNGEKAVLGQKINGPHEKVEVRYRAIHEKEYQYIAYYKPRGVITHTPGKKDQDIRTASGFQDLFPLGRLDKDSEGLILLTNDGRVTDRLLHPRFAHEKEYIVSLSQPFQEKYTKTLKAGVASEGEKLTLKRIEVIDPYTVSVVLTEGKKHQVRRMLESVGCYVTRLVRVRIMNVNLGNLKEGQSRELTGKAKQGFLKELGL
jgi:23S rRNA pseudouridine2604 synthase